MSVGQQIDDLERSERQDEIDARCYEMWLEGKTTDLIAFRAGREFRESQARDQAARGRIPPPDQQGPKQGPADPPP
jgi:hypothetical protein